MERREDGRRRAAAAAPAGTIRLGRIETPLGPMDAGDFAGRLCLLEFADRERPHAALAELERLLGAPSAPGRTPLHDEVERQLGLYFAGELRAFDLPLELPGTAFQRAAWEELLAIPYGEKRSYGEQASALGRPSSARAVAGADGRNRVYIVVPCHRVVGADGSLVGYGGGLPRKRALLELEGRRGGAADAR